MTSMLARDLLGEALETHALELARRRMYREAWQQFLEVAAALAGAAFGVAVMATMTAFCAHGLCGCS